MAASTEGARPTFGSAWIRETGTAISRRLGGALITFGQRLIAGSAEAGSPTLPAAVGVTGGDRFASLASMIPGVVYQRVVTPMGDIRYTYMSDGAREMFGVEPQDVVADAEVLFRTYSEDYKAHFKQRLVAASQSLTKWDVEASVVAADGSLRFTHAIATPERLADGSVLWTGLILDASRIKEVEDQLKAANRSVEAANKAKSMFLANMSHEIRTPMNGVLGMADLLLKTELNTRQHRLLGTLKHSAQTLLAIINDVLDISRIEAGRFDLEHEEVTLHRCLEDAIDLCAGAAYQKGLELNLIFEGKLPTTVVSDGGRLRQVLINLLGNAVKFTETGEVTLRASAVPTGPGFAEVKLEVIDTGIGIDAAAKEKLFAPFSQADSSISRRFGGTGLGLAITRHLVELMGGRVELDSEVGRGTKVTVTVPFEIGQKSEPSRYENTLAGKRLLFVDDRHGVRETLASKLHGTGADFTFADGEWLAIDQLHSAKDAGKPFAAVVVDRLRPGTDSSAFIETLRQDPRLDGLTIITVVSMNWKGQVPSVSAAERVVALAKPVRRHELLAALQPAVAAADRAKTEGGNDHSAEDEQKPLDLKVLVAEDNPVNQEVAREYLSGMGCTVVVVNNGAEALEAVAAESFDIVLMDCQMPVLDGLSAVRQIRIAELERAKPRLPVVAVTANAYESDRADAFEAGMDDYLVKPFSDAELRAILEKWQPGTRAKAAA